MKKKSLWLIVAFLLGTIATLNADSKLPKGKIEAIKKAIEFTGSKKHVQNAFKNLVTLRGEKKSKYIKNNLGENLSTFLLEANPKTLSEYNIQFDNSKLMDFLQAVTKTGRLVDLKQIKNIKFIKISGNKARGSFRFDSIMHKGVCLFKAEGENKTWKITKLFLQKKKSPNIEDGYIIINEK